MPVTKVKVIIDHKNPSFKEVLPIGYETELIPILSTVLKTVPNIEDVLLTKPKAKLFDINGKTFINAFADMERSISVEVVTIPVGSFLGYTFKGANGLMYSGAFIGNT